METLKNNNGSSYVFVMVIMFTVFLMLTLSLKVSQSNATISSSYLKTAGIYQLSESGILRSLQYINEIIVSSPSPTSTAEEVAYTVSSSSHIVGTNDFFNFFEYKIYTEDSKDAFTEYTIATSIKAEAFAENPTFIVKSSAKSSATGYEVTTQGTISLLYDEEGKVYPSLRLLRQVSN